LFQLLSQFGNPDLNPERGRGWDVGLEQNLLGNRLTFGAAYFGRRSTNLIEFVSCFRNADPRCRTRPSGFYENISRTDVQGLEVFANARPLERLVLRGHYTLTEAENASTGTANVGKTLPRRPRHLAFAEAAYTFPFGLEGSAAITRTGASFDDAANTNRLDDYTLVDVRLRFALTSGVQIFGRVDNLFDESYETTRRYGSPGRGAFVGWSLGL
jgi:vitamin B12 transporter